MRLFFAINFDDEVKKRVADAIQKIGIERPPWRWVERDNFHITLKFLGNTPEERVDGLLECAQDSVRTIAPFDMTLGRLSGFPQLGRPRVLFYEVDDGREPMERLAERLDATLEERLSIPRETRPFHAHATVARVKTRPPRALVARLEAAPAVEAASQRVSHVSLMLSTLRRQGAVYQSLKDIALPKPK